MVDPNKYRLEEVGGKPEVPQVEASKEKTPEATPASKTIKLKDTNKPAALAIREILEKRDIVPTNITADYQIDHLDKYTYDGNEFFKGTVQRTITYDKDKKLIIEQEIFTSVAFPDALQLSNRSFKEDKMRALFAIAAHEDIVMKALKNPNDKKIDSLATKQAISSEFLRAARSEGFYGKQDVKFEKSNLGFFKSLFTKEGSIIGTLVEGLEVGADASMWAKFDEIKCLPIDGIFIQANTIRKDFAIMAKGNSAIESNESLQKLRDKINSDVGANKLAMLQEREIADDIDTLNFHLERLERTGLQKLFDENAYAIHNIAKSLQEAKEELQEIQNKIESAPAIASVDVPLTLVESQSQLHKTRTELEKQIQELTQEYLQAFTQTTFDKLKERMDFLQFIIEIPTIDGQNKDTHTHNLKYLQDLIASKNLKNRFEKAQKSMLDEISLFAAQPQKEKKPIALPTPESISAEKLEQPTKKIENIVQASGVEMLAVQKEAARDISDFTLVNTFRDGNCFYSSLAFFQNRDLDPDAKVPAKILTKMRKDVQAAIREVLNNPTHTEKLRKLLLDEIDEYNADNERKIAEKEESISSMSKKFPEAIPVLEKEKQALKESIIPNPTTDAAIKTYVDRISNDRFWGGVAELYAYCVVNKIKASVVFGQTKQPYTGWNPPKIDNPEDTLRLDYEGGGHFNVYLPKNR